MDNKQMSDSIGVIAADEYESQELTSQSSEVEQFVDSTIISILREYNIFENIISVEEIRNKLLDIVKHVVFEDMSEKGWNGYWRAADGTLAVEERLKNKLDSLKTKETIIHELLHALSTKERAYNNEIHQWESWVGIQRYFGGKETGRGLDEGITEYLAQKLCPQSEYRYNSGLVEFNVSGTYPMEQIVIKQIAILYGEDKIIDAYLNNHDIDMPQEQYLELRTDFDYINEKDSQIRNIYKGRTWEELSKAEQTDILRIRNQVEGTFIQSQQYFLENCLMDEISNISTLEQAEVMKSKLRELNSLGINIFGNENANYKKYNFAFIRKYLQIVNQDKSYDEQVSFDDIEKYLIGEETDLTAINNKVLETTEVMKQTDSQRFFNNIGAFFVGGFQELVEEIKDVPIISPIINGVKKVKNFVESRKKEQFVAIDRGQEGKIYIKEVGQNVIAGNNVSVYEFLTEEQYIQYIAGDTSVKGEILRGNIDFNKLKKDKEYAYYLGYHLLAQDRIEEKLLNYNGYVGSIGEDNRENVIEQVQERLEETEKYIKITPDGYEQDMYITEIQNKDSKELSRYIILTRDEVEKRRKQGMAFEPTISVQGNINLRKLIADDKYREVLERDVLAKERIEERSEHFKGYVGKIISNGYEYFQCDSAKYLEQFASQGANGEEKRCDTNGPEPIDWYLKKGDKTGERDEFGNELYEYEFITSDEMKKMWADKEYKDSPDRERYILISSERDMSKDMGYTSMVLQMVFNGGYIGNDHELAQRCIDKKCLPLNGEVIWENNGIMYLSKIDGLRFLETKTKLLGNFDIERFRKDPKYRNFVKENVLTEQNIEDIFAGDRNSIEIVENDGKFSCVISKKVEATQLSRQSHNRTGQDIDR